VFLVFADSQNSSSPRQSDILEVFFELIAEAKSNKSPLYVAFMDARKAFDVVWHTGLFRDLYTLA
jgi:hypothetical protein